MTDDQDDSKIEVVFVPGCFDGFEGSQEELEQLIEEIKKMVDDGSIFEKATLLDIDDLDELENYIDAAPGNRTLQ